MPVITVRWAGEMLAAVNRLATELRAVGVPVSMVEVLDAASALRHVDLADRAQVRFALSATMIKNLRHQPAFDTAFDVVFSPLDAASSSGHGEGAAGARPLHLPTDVDATDIHAGGGAADAADLVEGIVAALRGENGEELRRLVRAAVDAFSGFQGGRPVGGRYYAHRVMSRLDADDIRRRLLEAALTAPSPPAHTPTPLDAHIAETTAAQHLAELERVLADEILRRLVDDRGPDAVARTLRRPLVDDLDLMHATREELDEISKRVTPLARKLASRLSARRRQGRRGRLDVRRTIRRSLAHGGALIEPRWRPRHVGKPELVLLCDVSGSMATFARFTLQLTYAIGHQFSNVRTFAFVDGVDEVTSFMGPGADFAEALVRISTEADVVDHDGHSDYGTALRRLDARFPDAVTARSTVIITGDARNNYRDPGTAVMAGIADRARAVHWLNPESRRYWDTGDSIMATYSSFCDGVHEVRTLRQLEVFVESVALGRHRASIRSQVHR